RMEQTTIQKNLFVFDASEDYYPWLLMSGVIVVAVVILNIEGRVWWCQAGDYIPWSWDIWSQHNSQHLIDPYSFTHVLHGILEFWIIGLIFGRIPVAWRLFMAVVIEG